MCRLRIVPRARVTAFAGTHGDRLKIRVGAPPLDGRANAELIAFLARQFGVPYQHPKDLDEFISVYRAAQKENFSTIIELTTNREENFRLHVETFEAISRELSAGS